MTGRWEGKQHPSTKGRSKSISPVDLLGSAKNRIELRQVSWLVARVVPLPDPIRTNQWLRTTVSTTHSGGTAPDCHRIPF